MVTCFDGHEYFRPTLGSCLASYFGVWYLGIIVWPQSCYITRKGTTAAFVLHSFTHQHKCRCRAYFRFSGFRIPLSYVSTFSIIHPQCNYNTHNATSCSRVAVRAGSNNGKVLASFPVPGTSAVISITTFNLCTKMVANITQVINE
jgi:hypothetical protein